MKILINGLCDSAGKTTATIGLSQYFSEIGETISFKPFGANDYWYDHSIVMEGIEGGRLYGKDAKLLSKLSGLSEEKINPIYRLWAPRSLVGGGAGIGREDSSLVLDRIMDQNEVKLAVNSQVAVPGKLGSLFKSADKTEEFSGTTELDELTREIYLPAIEKRFNEISDKQFLIIESYSDVAMPIFIDVDIVITVEPGRALVTPGERFLEAYSLISEKWGSQSREIGTSKVLKTLDSEEIRLDPSSLEDFKEIKGVYEKVYGYIENQFLD